MFGAEYLREWLPEVLLTHLSFLPQGLLASSKVPRHHFISKSFNCNQQSILTNWRLIEQRWPFSGTQNSWGQKEGSTAVTVESQCPRLFHPLSTPCADSQEQNTFSSRPPLPERSPKSTAVHSVCTQSFGKYNYSPSPRLWNCCTTAVKHAAVIITDKRCMGPGLLRQYNMQTMPRRSTHLVPERYQSS